FVLGAAVPPEPRLVSTTVASTADAGALDAHLARVEGASVIDSRSTITGDIVLVVDDGSGALDVTLDRDGGFVSAPLPGAVLDASGVLVPSAQTAGRWTLKPRSGDDIDFDYPTVTV